MKSIALFTVILAAGLAGCASSTAPDDPHSLENERPLGQQDQFRVTRFGLLNLHDGFTRREDVVRLMGEPDRTAADGNVIVYHWMAKRDDVLVWHFFLLQFDKLGILQRHQLKTGDSADGGPDTFDKALQGWAKP